MSFDKEEFEDAERELERIVNNPSVLKEEYTEETDGMNRAPDQLIWKYIYKNVSGSLRRELAKNPPEEFPAWLRELFAEEYSDPDEDFPVDELVHKALKRLVQRRLTA